MAAPLPGRGGAGRADRRAHRAVRADPRPEVRRPLLEVALQLPVAYIGAMGSRRTHDDRRAGCSSAADRGGAGADVVADRARPRRAHTGGDGGVDRGGDDRDARGGGCRLADREGPTPTGAARRDQSPPARTARPTRSDRSFPSATAPDRAAPTTVRPRGEPDAISPARPAPGVVQPFGTGRQGVAVVASMAPSGSTTRPGRPGTMRYGKATWSSSTTPGASPPRPTSPRRARLRPRCAGGRVGPAPGHSGGAAATRTARCACRSSTRRRSVRARPVRGRARRRPPGRAPAVRRHRPRPARGGLAERAAHPAQGGRASPRVWSRRHAEPQGPRDRGRVRALPRGRLRRRARHRRRLGDRRGQGRAPCSRRTAGASSTTRASTGSSTPSRR